MRSLVACLMLAFAAVLLLALTVPAEFVAWMWALAGALLLAAATCAVISSAQRNKAPTSLRARRDKSRVYRR